MGIEKAVATLACALSFVCLSEAAGKTQAKPKEPSAPKPALLPYQDARLSIEDRVADLLSRMTLEEKVAQIAGGGRGEMSVIDPTGTFTPEEGKATLRRISDYQYQLSPRKYAILRNGAQRYLREKTRLGIPALFMGEALHGFMQNGSTSFPQALGLAATWDPELVHRVFTAAGDEAGSSGTGQVFSPVLDLARDPRWGRTEETYGEDPYLVSRMGVAAITGLQGDRFLIDRHHVLATAKHYAAHGQPEGGRNTAPANYSERILREEFLLPFEAAVREARAGSVMASYNEIDGIPAHINHWLLTQVLRQEWGFPGYVVSDGNGLQMLVSTHLVAATKADAARLAIAAGVDYDLSDGSVYRTLVDQVQRGIVPESDLDRAVRLVLTTKFRLGLFDDPYVDPDYAERITNGPAHQKLALEAAQKTIVLLKNEGSLLPLDLTKTKTIAVIGPNAADVHLGGYSREPAHNVSILQGIRERAGTQAEVLYAEGCKITNAIQGWRAWQVDKVEVPDPKTQADSIRAAVEAARKAQVAIVVVGENEGTNREAWSDRHLGDRASLDLLGAQDELVKAVVETGTPTVVFLINGRPLSINWIAEHVPAVLEGFYLGQEGGTAAANVLFGDVNPGGKLPITFPRSVGQLPAYYYAKPSRNRDYAFEKNGPLFPFGYGLSYTTFRFDNLRVTPDKIAVGGAATVSVDVTNTGTRKGDEVVQLYVHQKIASVTRPVEILRGFERVTLEPGAKKTVELRITPDALSMINVDMHRVVEPGIFELKVGPSSAQTSSVTLAVTGAQGETGITPPPPPPAGSDSALISSFDDLTTKTAYGTWDTTTDAVAGGKSRVSMEASPGGANASKGALHVRGEVVYGSLWPWAVVQFLPSGAPGQPANLSAKKEIAFLAKGDGKSYSVAVMTEAREGQMPAKRSIVPGPEWKEYSFPLASFGTDGHDLTAVGIMQDQAGPFELWLDQFEIR